MTRYHRTMRFQPHGLQQAFLTASLIGGLIICSASCTTDEPDPADLSPAETAASSSRHLFVWAGDEDREDTDFLAVVDIDPDSPRYTEIISTVPVGVAGNAHHTEHGLAADGRLFANSFDAGASFIFDLADPFEPGLLASFTNVGDFTYPHSFERTPQGTVLATFQNKGAGNQRTGGLVELTTEGVLVRASDADDPEHPELRPYSLGLVPELDRIVTTTTDMRGGPESTNSWIQIWRLSNLELLATLPLPSGPNGREQYWPAEPRALSDGRRVLVTTFSCGFYLLDGLDTDAPSVKLVLSYPWEIWEHECSVPTQAGDIWIQTVTTASTQALVSLDLSDPEQPREVGRLAFGPDAIPHWISLEPEGDRVVITGYGSLAGRVLLARVDRQTGALELDDSFREPGAEAPGISFQRDRWPHGPTGPAVPHGSVFALP